MPVRAEEKEQKKVFTKDQIISSKKYRSNRDLLNALLDGDGKYTLEEVDKKISNFKKGKVK